MKLIKTISLAGFFSFASSAAVWATENKMTPDLEKQYVEYKDQIYSKLHFAENHSLSAFKKPVINLARLIKQGLSDEDHKLISKIDGIENKPKYDEFLKSIATLRLVAFRDQSEDEKNKDIQNISTILKMVEDYEAVKIPEVQHLPQKVQDDIRKIIYIDTILCSQESKDVATCPLSLALKNKIQETAEAVANEIQLRIHPNNQFSLWLSKAGMNWVSYVTNISKTIKNKQDLDKIIDTEKKYAEYKNKTDNSPLREQNSLSAFKKTANDLARLIKPGLSDEDHKLISEIEGIENKPKDEEFLKNIATLRLVALKWQSYDKKSKDIQNISTILKMMEDYEGIKIQEVQNLSPERQDDIRKNLYIQTILCSQKSKDIANSLPSLLGNFDIANKANAVANGIQLRMSPNNQWDLWLRKDGGNIALQVTSISNIIKNKKQLDKSIEAYNKEPKKTERTSLRSLSLPSFSSRRPALKKSFAKNADKKKRRITKKPNKKKGAKNSKKMTKREREKK